MQPTKSRSRVSLDNSHGFKRRETKHKLADVKAKLKHAEAKTREADRTLKRRSERMKPLVELIHDVKDMPPLVAALGKPVVQVLALPVSVPTKVALKKSRKAREAEERARVQAQALHVPAPPPTSSTASADAQKLPEGARDKP
jgi:hypothetical protein